jgi:hypothetical protein
MDDKNKNVTRDDLYAQVWSQPISKLAGTYNVSGSYLALICSKLKIPTPGRGYWALVAVGKAPAKEALPTLIAGDPTMWIRTPMSSRNTDELPTPPNLRTEIPSKKRNRPPHGLLVEAREIFAKAKTSYSSIYTSPRHRNLLDIITTPDHLEDSLSLAEKFLARLADYGYHVRLADGESNIVRIRIDTEEVIPTKKNDNYYSSLWRPGRNTVAYIGTVAIGLSIVEMKEEVKVNDPYNYAHTKTVGSRRYRIYTYSPYRYTKLEKAWQDTKELRIEKQFDEIISAMEEMARQIPNLILEGEKRAAEEQARRDEEQRERKRKQAEEMRKQTKSESLDDLEKMIQAWAREKNRRAFIDELIMTLDKENLENQDELAQRLDTARALLSKRSVIDLIKSWQTPEEKFKALPPWQRGEGF